MKVAIITADLFHENKAPYIKYYRDFFEENNIGYDIIYWNRNSKKIINSKDNLYCFNYFSPEQSNYIVKLYSYWRFSSYVVNIIKDKKYNFITVHTIVNAMFLKRILLKKYKNRYIFDIRDYSPIVPFSKYLLRKLIDKSSFTVISSLGFQTWLPKSNKYIMGHNVSKKLVLDALTLDVHNFKKIDANSISILTIGNFRDYLFNVNLIPKFASKANYSLHYYGGGNIKIKLEQYIEKSKFQNVFFYGTYNKNDENKIVQMYDFINILMPSNILESSLTSNRFYLSILNRKPLIVNKESFQSELVKKYNLGVMISSNNDIIEEINKYVNEMNYDIFYNGCINCLKDVYTDILYFEERILELSKQL